MHGGSNSNTNKSSSQQEFLNSTDEDAVSPVDQLSLYNSPLGYSRFATQQQGITHSPNLDTYTTNPSTWFPSGFSANGVALDLAGLGPVYPPTDDAHSSTSSASSMGLSSTDVNSLYSTRNHKLADSSTSSPEYSSYTHTKGTSSYSSTSSASSASGTPSSSHESPSSKRRQGSDGKVKRSRMGCLICRQRKKRCCETRPRCHECARLGLKCTWPTPGSEHRNKPKHVRISDGMHYDPFYGNIKILRGIVENKIDAN